MRLGMIIGWFNDTCGYRLRIVGACFANRLAPPDSVDKMFIVRLYRARLVTQEPMCLIGLVDPFLCGRIEVHPHRSFAIGIDRHELQTQFPPSRIELWNAPQFPLPSLHSVLIKAGTRNPIPTIATTINGHSTTTQKEKS